ncbi:unnamed protein product [Prorocentrum cordatum]|uniref:Uncharacterized protein n=1 Tax=Prorocentrum cordatum TaxID=2364126 RepID=A0ABN9TIX3_9DINO|nr:unnamed protein product [Polarella glacialis]
MQSLAPALLLLVLSAPLASSLSVHQEHAWSWPWSRKPAAEAPKPAAAVAEEAPAAAEAAPAEATNSTLRIPTEPGCFMRMPSGCPKNPMRTELWRHDTWAEKKAFDEEGCMKRKSVWDGYCESQDAQMIFVAGKVSALQVDQSWPWSKKGAKAVESKLEGETTTVEAPAPQQAQRASTKIPSQPGCYMRMLSGCPKEPMRTFLWRHDPFAEERGLGEADCLKRKSTWDKHCDSKDAEMVFVGKDAAQAADTVPPAAEAATAAEAQGGGLEAARQGELGGPAPGRLRTLAVAMEQAQAPHHRAGDHDHRAARREGRGRSRGRSAACGEPFAARVLHADPHRMPQEGHEDPAVAPRHVGGGARPRRAGVPAAQDRVGQVLRVAGRAHAVRPEAVSTRPQTTLFACEQAISGPARGPLPLTVLF